MDDRAKGLILTTLGVLLVVPDSLFVRLIDGVPMVTAFWRALTAGLVVLAAVLATEGTRGIRAVLAAGWPAWVYMLLMGTTAPGFVMAVTHTSVANVVFIFALMPLFAALFSWALLGEAVSRRLVVTMAVALIGLGIIAYGSGTSEIASIKGDLWALYVTGAYALALTLVRRVRGVSMVPAVPLAYLGAAALLYGVAVPAGSFAAHAPLYIGHGAFIGLATCFLSLGPRYIGAAEVSLLVLLESVLAPLLVWALIGEHPGRWALMGGFIVIGALVVSNWIALRRAPVAQG